MKVDSRSGIQDMKEDHTAIYQRAAGQFERYTALLKDELRAATGCTEPIAIAYCAALSARALGTVPTRCEAACSGNVIKNTKTVTVPNTGGMKGIKAAVLAGVLFGDADRELEVLSAVSPDEAETIKKMAATLPVAVKLLKSGHSLHIQVTCFAGESWASAEIMDTHTGVSRVTRNGAAVFERESGLTPDSQRTGPDEAALNVADILDYARRVDLSGIRDVLLRQAAYNSAIAKAGMSGDWGASVGKTLLLARGDNDKTRIVSGAAAGADARMNGCALPVIINSGSGNQGMTASLPVVERARQLGAPEELLLRALAVSNLVSIHQKTAIGRMSAYCGAVSAATGSAVGIAFLEGASDEVIKQTIVNSLAVTSGMLCDGAKSSCAGKIANALDGALLAYEMAKRDLGYQAGEGIVKKDVESTIQGVGQIASQGMRETDIEVLQVMIRED